MTGCWREDYSLCFDSRRVTVFMWVSAIHFTQPVGERKTKVGFSREYCGSNIIWKVVNHSYGICDMPEMVYEFISRTLTWNIDASVYWFSHRMHAVEKYCNLGLCLSPLWLPALPTLLGSFFSKAQTHLWPCLFILKSDCCVESVCWFGEMWVNWFQVP